FFSSRRRHTRFSRDWSSDVCSSDLKEEYDRKALLEVWYCFKEFLIKEMKSGSRVKIYRDLVLQKDLDIPKLLKNEKWLNDHLKIAYVLEKYFKIGNNKNTFFKKEEENTE